MPKPLKRRELIRRLRALGFEGPFSGSKHQFMVRGSLKLRIPNPHDGDIGAASWPNFYAKRALIPKAGIARAPDESVFGVSHRVRARTVRG